MFKIKVNLVTVDFSTMDFVFGGVIKILTKGNTYIASFHVDDDQIFMYSVDECPITENYLIKYRTKIQDRIFKAIEIKMEKLKDHLLN